MAVSKRIADRIKRELKRYQGILSDAKGRDVSESDTVTILVDMLADVFGYDKYAEVTKEFAIRGTYCDLAVKVGEDLRFLIEAKAVGVELKDQHVKQAVDYAANQGIEWVLLTNGVTWQIYKILFQQPVEKALVLEWDVLSAEARDEKNIECLANLTKEGFTTSSMNAFYQQQQAANRFSLAALLQGERMLKTLRKELRKVAPKLKIETKALAETLRNEVFKRELIDSEEAKQAAQFIKKAMRSAKSRAEASTDKASSSPSAVQSEIVVQAAPSK